MRGLRRGSKIDTLRYSRWHFDTDRCTIDIRPDINHASPPRLAAATAALRAAPGPRLRLCRRRAPFRAGSHSAVHLAAVAQPDDPQPGKGGRGRVVRALDA